MSTDNWRPEVDAADFFGHQKKRMEVDSRRPVIRRPSDLVGPGINKTAVRLSNFNDSSAMFNGFYSADAGALNAPNAAEPFVGFTVSDSVLGGMQVFRGVNSGIEYRRLFKRSSMDPDSISWDNAPWESDVPASAIAPAASSISVPTGTSAFVDLPMPATFNTNGDPDTYAVVSGNRLQIKRPGTYTGYLMVETLASFLLEMSFTHPAMVPGGEKTYAGTAVLSSGGLWRPFTFATKETTRDIRVAVKHSQGSSQTVYLSQLSITRIGDA